MERSALDEAMDPTTTAERLDELDRLASPLAVQRASRRNPARSTDTLKLYLEMGDPDAWANPSVPLVRLVAPSSTSLQRGAMAALVDLTTTPRPDLADALRENLVPMANEWWQNPEVFVNELADHLIKRAHDPAGIELRAATLAAVALDRAAHAADPREGAYHRALDELEAWGRGSNVRTPLELLASQPKDTRINLPYPHAVLSVAMKNEAETAIAVLVGNLARSDPDNVARTRAERRERNRRPVLAVLPEVPLPAWLAEP